MGNCTCKQSLRFKRLIDAVYPADVEGDAKFDAIGKVALYVAHNPESVPLVCRRVGKTLRSDIAKGRLKRVSVSAQLLHQLLRSTDMSIEYYVPFVVDVAEELLQRDEPECVISGADVLNALAYQLAVNLDFDSASRRLLADRCGTALAVLSSVASEGVGTQRVDALHCRYSALVCLGNLAAALGQMIADRTETLLLPVLRTLHESALEAERRADAALQAASMTRRSARFDAAASHMHWVQEAEADCVTPIDSVVLPVDPDAKDARYRAACVRALACIAPCATTATLPAIIATTFAYLSTRNGWGCSTYAVVVNRVVAVSVQQHHRSGFLVSQHIASQLESDVRSADLVVTMLDCLRHVVATVPMSGTRPTAIFTTVSRYVTGSVAVTGADVGAAAKAALVTVAARSLAQRNIQAVQRILAALARHVRNVVTDAQKAVAAQEKNADAASSGAVASHIASIVTTVKDRVGVVLELLADIATVACTLSAADRVESGFVTALISVLQFTSHVNAALADQSGAEATACSTASLQVSVLLGLVRYTVQPRLTPDGRIDGAGLAFVSLVPMERDAIVDWLLTAIAQPSTLMLPAVSLGCADLAVALLRDGDVSVFRVLDALFDAQQTCVSKCGAAQHERRAVTMVTACITAAVLRAIGLAVGSRELVAYAEHAERLNELPGVCRIAPNAGETVSHDGRDGNGFVTPRRKHADDDEPTDVDASFSPASPARSDDDYSDVAPRTPIRNQRGRGAAGSGDQSRRAAAAWSTLATSTALGCGLVLDCDVDFILPFTHRVSREKNPSNTSATPVSRPTVALYLRKLKSTCLSAAYSDNHAGPSSARFLADMAELVDEEAVVARVMGEHVDTAADRNDDGRRTPPTYDETPRIQRVASKMSNRWTTALITHVDPSQATSVVASQRLPSFLRSLGGAIMSKPALASITAHQVVALQNGSVAEEAPEEQLGSSYESWLANTAPDAVEPSPSVAVTIPAEGVSECAGPVSGTSDPVCVG